MQLKIIEVNTDSPSAIESEMNNWLAGQEFSKLQISNIVEYPAPRKCTRIYVVYELAGSLVSSSSEDEE